MAADLVGIYPLQVPEEAAQSGGHQQTRAAQPPVAVSFQPQSPGRRQWTTAGWMNQWNGGPRRG